MINSEMYRSVFHNHREIDLRWETVSLAWIGSVDGEWGWFCIMMETDL